MKKIFEAIKVAYGKVKDFLMDSNHYKHILGGFAVGICGGTPWTALYAGFVAGACLELKDKLYGQKFDIVDLICTFAGAVVAAAILSLQS